MKKVYVGDSDIHGQGLFAKKKIKRGELIGKIEANKAKKNGPYVLWVADNEGYKVKGPLKYINHSNKPNAAYLDDLTVVALKDIKKGDEITHNYGDGWDK